MLWIKIETHQNKLKYLAKPCLYLMKYNEYIGARILLHFAYYANTDHWIQSYPFFNYCHRRYRLTYFILTHFVIVFSNFDSNISSAFPLWIRLLPYEPRFKKNNRHGHGAITAYIVFQDQPLWFRLWYTARKICFGGFTLPLCCVYLG